MTRLLFDLTSTQPALGAKRHGGGIYGEIVLSRIIDRGLPVEVWWDSSKWLNPDVRTMLEANGVKMHDINGSSLPAIVAASDCDRVYTCGESPEFRDLQHPAKYYTLHGMREVEMPFDKWYYRYKEPLKDQAKFFIKSLLLKRYRAKHINRVEEMIQSGTRFVVVSNHTASSIKAHLPEHIGLDIPVFYSPDTCHNESKTVNSNPDRYFLLVSGNRWLKNNLRAIEALDRAFDSPAFDGFKAVVAGAKGTEQYRYKFRHPERFDFRGYVDDDELARLYSRAYAFIYPTLNEGFGYPPLEAMSYGTPVLASPLTSIPEVCGDAAIYFDPYSIEEILSRIIMIANPSKRAEMSRRAIERQRAVAERQHRDLDLLIDFLYQ